MRASTISPADRLPALRAEIARLGLGGLILTTADAFQNEETPAHGRVVEWLTGFTGSLGHVLVTADSAILLVDGRYTIQADREVSGAWQRGHLHDAPLAYWLKVPGTRVGFDPMDWTVRQCARLRQDAPLVDFVDVADPVGPVWSDRPAPPCAPLRPMPEAEAGRSVADKLDWLARATADLGADLWVETRPDAIAWMFNVRGADVPMTPVPLSFAIFRRVGPALWFIDPAKLTAPLADGVEARAFDAFLTDLAALANGTVAAFDPGFTPEAVARALRGAGAVCREAPGLITVAKARKTAAELAGFRRAHLADGVALARFGHWLSCIGAVSETDAAEALAAFRAASPLYLEPSFATIAASGANAALCHYHPPAVGSGTVGGDALFLCDSGGQYACGTTDVTRTHAFGPVPDDIRRVATAVLQGFIALHALRFPAGTMPHQIDAVARAPLWAMGLDYDHGTGHDVGHALSVHEHPHRIGKAANPYPMAPGNVLTLEPGYYAEGRWGIRIENQVEVVEDGPGFLRFEPLTLAAIDLTSFDLDCLTAREVTWIDTYHARVRAGIAQLLDPDARAWLLDATRPVIPAVSRQDPGSARRRSASAGPRSGTG